jgi:hypothetical protein
VATGAIGVVAEVLPPVFGWAYVLCGALLLVWLLLVWLIGIAFVPWTLGAQTLRNRQLEAAEAMEPAQRLGWTPRSLPAGRLGASGLTVHYSVRLPWARA